MQTQPDQPRCRKISSLFAPRRTKSVRSTSQSRCTIHGLEWRSSRRGTSRIPIAACHRVRIWRNCPRQFRRACATWLSLRARSRIQRRFHSKGSNDARRRFGRRCVRRHRSHRHHENRRGRFRAFRHLGREPFLRVKVRPSIRIYGDGVVSHGFRVRREN